MTPIKWLAANYGFIITIIVVLIILFSKQIKSYFKKEKKETVEDTLSELSSQPLFTPEESGLFDTLPTKDTLSNFYQQKKLAEHNIKQLKKEGKNLLIEEKKFAVGYTQKKNSFVYQRKQLGLKYTSWANQLKATENMINNQIDIEREFDKMKGGNAGNKG